MTMLCVHCASPAGKPHLATCAFVVLSKWKRSDPRGRVKDSKPSVAIAAETLAAEAASLRPSSTAECGCGHVSHEHNAQLGPCLGERDGRRCPCMHFSYKINAATGGVW